MKRRKQKGKSNSEELAKAENLLKDIIGEKVSKNKSVEKVKIKSTSRITSSETKKRRRTRFRFPKSTSSQSGQYAHVKSRYLNVFKKTEERKSA